MIKLPPKLTGEQLDRVFEENNVYYLYKATGRYTKRAQKLSKNKWYLVKGQRHGQN